MKDLTQLQKRVQELELAILSASRYQPRYNGRPSCPFCGNYIDNEETHLESCIVNTIEHI